MQNKFVQVFVVLFLGLWTLGCNSETLEPDPTRLGFVYFPLSKGLYKTYEIEQVNYRVTGEVDTSRYHLKESVVDSFKNVNNNYTYILHRFTKGIQEQHWKQDSVWSSRVTPRQAIVVENNIPLVKMIFPLKESGSWDGNSLNALDEETYTMVNLDKPFEYKDMKVDRSVTIIQKDNEDSIIFLDQRKEVYAQNIGLVYKEATALKYCAQVHCIGLGEVESGTIYRQFMIENGKE